MEKTFQPKDIETKWYKIWEKRGYFAPKAPAGNDTEAYSIVIPPPMSQAVCTSATHCKTALWTP